LTTKLTKAAKFMALDDGWRPARSADLFLRAFLGVLGG